MNEILAGAFRQLLTTSPILLVYLTGVVLALVNWQRYPSPARFTFFGCAVLFVTSVAQAFAFQYLFFERAQLGWSATQVGMMLSVLGLITSLLHAAGLGLLLAGVFTGRSALSPSLVAPTPHA